jgi:hypothetical protein
MPAAPSRARRESMRDSIAGGTAVDTPEGNGFPWLFAGVCAAAAITAIVWYVSSGGARAAEPASQPVEARATGPGAAVVPAGPATPASDVEPPTAPTVDPRPRQRADLLASLAHTLESDQLWATVTEVGDGVELRSSFCADRGMGARIDAVAAPLAQLGFTSVRCLEKGGTPVWKRDLH